MLVFCPLEKVTLLLGITFPSSVVVAANHDASAVLTVSWSMSTPNNTVLLPMLASSFGKYKVARVIASSPVEDPNDNNL